MNITLTIVNCKLFGTFVNAALANKLVAANLAEDSKIDMKFTKI